METDVDHPGFAKLRLVSTPFYLSARRFIDNVTNNIRWLLFKHGPCLSDKNQIM